MVELSDLTALEVTITIGMELIILDGLPRSC